MFKERALASVTVRLFPRGHLTLPNLSQWRSALAMWRQPVLLASLIVTGAVWGVRQVGELEPWELAIYDRMVQLNPADSIGSRLLIVEVAESDIKAQNRWPLSDQTYAQALQALQRYQPRVIGLDILRDVPQEPGRAELLKQLRSPNVITITTLGEDPASGTPAPTGVPSDRIGFNDVVSDADDVIRRNLIFGDEGTTQFYSFALRLAEKYLAVEGITPQAPWNRYAAVPWGKAVFTPLRSTSGGYQTVDANGYQILINYQAHQRLARRVRLTQVLQGDIKPEWVRDKIVLVGTTAPSIKDVFLTPYSAVAQGNPKEAGVLIHAQMVGQMVNAVLGEPLLFWYWPEWGEALWLWSWAIVGGALAWRIRHPVYLGVAVSGAVLILFGSTFGLFLLMGWVPFVPPAIALVTTSVGVISYFAYQAQQERKEIAAQVEDQEKTIALLKTYLTQTTSLTQTTQLDLETRLATDSTKRADTTYIPDSTIRPDDATVGIPEEEVRDQHLAGPVEDNISDRPRFLLSRRYKIDRILGSGGFSLTYLAEDTQRPGNPLCVVKHLVPARSDARFLQTARRLFKSEAEILEKLGKHDQIPQLLAAFEEKAEFYLVEEYVEGHPLSDELRSGQRLTEPQVISLLKAVLEVLTYLHERHVIHRDLKPSNIIRRDQDQQLVLIDFGAVKQMQPQDFDHNNAEEGFTVAIGTRGYAPAEQLAGYPGLTSDVYALGMIAIQALTGTLPYQLQQNPETGTVQWRHLTEVSDRLATILDKMVRYYFNERYQSATEVLRDLKALGSD